ncbi:hypothetical protein Y032_0255g313 [Ancylostoma ceylanicum]|uniref:Uncharacterized protein n=1 Tax=Ancylostoma ceylanicum TaxID=53326 RepID=A0A016SC66_9BILA|nr:hypothetical protein Y032_0255g313 [Ancylostoma ceylanicum]
MSAHDYLFNLAVQQFAQQFYAANLLLAQNPEQLYQHQDVLPSLQNPLQLPRELYSVPAQAIPVAAVQPPPVEEAPATAPQPVRLFRGEVEHHKKTSREDTLIYRCSGCRHQNEKFTSVHVTGDVFHTDPCLLPHNCAPLDRYGDKADRVTYQKGQNMRKDKTAHRIPPRRRHADTEQSILTMDWRTRKIRYSRVRRQEKGICQSGMPWWPKNQECHGGVPE